mgnify:CR=1 FL=1
MKLTDREWKTFKIGDLFEIKKVQGLPIENYKDGIIPYVSTSSVNNGSSNFISAPNEAISDKNALSIDPIKGKVFYHPYNFVGRGFSGASINLLYNKHLTKYNALFLATAIEKTASSKASYGYLFNGNRLKYGIILLPTTEGKPDYQFMEDYIKEIMRTKRQEYINYARRILAGGGNTRLIQPLIDKNWKAFRITDIFPSIQRGKRLVKEKQVAGMIPYVSSTAMNNGVDNFIQYDEHNMRKYSNCLSIANSGSVGSTFYEPFAFIASDHITHLKNKDFTQNIYLFIATLGNRLSQKYNFNREINDSRISREKIMLPTDDSGNPDYEYMEQYTQNVMLSKYNDYLQYANNLNC